MHSTFAGRRAGRFALASTATLMALAACRSDAVTGDLATCTDQPGCVTTVDVVSPPVVAALDDAGTRLVGSLDRSSASALTSRIARVQSALEKQDFTAGRIALASAYDMISQLERSTPEARPDLGAIRLALIPAASALGISASIALSGAP